LIRCPECNSDLMMNVSRVWVEHQAGAALIIGISFKVTCAGCGFERHLVDYRALEMRL